MIIERANGDSGSAQVSHNEKNTYKYNATYLVDLISVSYFFLGHLINRDEVTAFKIFAIKHVGFA